MKTELYKKWGLRSVMLILMLGVIGVTKGMAQTYTNTSALQTVPECTSESLTSTTTNDIVKAETVGVIPYSDDFITQEEVMDRYYAITSYRMIDTATVAVLTGASNMILVYSLNQNQILYKIQLPISAKAFEYDNNLFHVIGDRTYLTVDSEGIIHERKDFQRPNKDFFVITDLKILDGQPIIHECDATTYTIASDRLQETDAFYYHHARGSKIHPQYIDENSFVLYNETPTRSGNINVSMESLGLEGKLACLDCISVDDDHIAINLQTTYNRNGSFIKSYLLVVDPNGELINLVEVPINFLSYIHKSFLYKDNAWYYAFSGLEGISFFKIDMSTNRVDSPDPSILQDENIDYIYHEPENGTSFEDTNNGDPTRGNWRTITQVWYNANQYCIMDWTPIPDNIATECTWIGGSGGGYISTPIINYYYTETGVPYKWAGFTDRMSFVALASEGKKTGNIWTNRNSNFSCPGDAYSSDSDNYVIGVDCSGYVSNCWEVGHQGTSTIKNICSDYGYVINATSNSIFQSGDALTKEGDHVMLYRGHNSSNNKIQVFQASARDWKTSPYEYLTSYFSGYKIFRYNNMKNIILRLGSDIELRQNGSTVSNVTQGVPLTVNYSVKNFGNETWTGYVSLWIEQSNGTLVCIQGESQNGLTTLSAGSTQSFTFSNNGVSSPVGTTKFYVKVKNYNAGGHYGERNYDVGSLSNSNPLVFQIVEGGGGGSGHDCTEIPDYDFSRTVSTSWSTHSSSIEANCWKIYRFSVSPNYTYCFTTGCGGGAEADFDTKLYLYNQNGSLIISDDDGCSGSNKSIINYNSNASGYVYLKVAGYSSSHGDYTLAYMKSSNCTTVPDYDYSRTVYTTWSTHSSSIEADCWKIYRFSVSPDYSYCFKTGCGNGADADFDTYLYLYDQNGQELARNDDECSGNTSKIDYESNSSGYVYLKVAGYGSSDYGDYTLAYIKESTVPTSYIISVSASPSIGGSVSGGGQYVNGNSCTLIASANTGYTFARWTKNGSQVSTSPTYTFTVTENASYVAVFTLNSYAITTSANPTAGGTVSSGGNFDHGSTCTLTATANTGYTFVRWTKNGSQVSTSPTYTFTVTENASYVAVFSLNSYTISASASPTAGGSVNGAGTYSHGSTCNLTASANIGYSFVNWTENGTQVSDNTNYTFVVNGNRNLMANFSLNSYDITTSVTPINGGRVTGLRVFWEELFEFTCSSGGQPAIATDGNFIYTASWQTTPIGGYTFYKYNLDGSFVEGFNISDVTCIRDLTYDGTYFYAGNGSTSIFQLDFNAKTLIRTINTTFNTRHCEYDPVNDGFWIGDWHTLYLVNRSGNVMLTGPAINGGYGAYGAAYYTADDNTPHLYLFCQSGSSNAQVVDYNINTNTLGAVLFDFENCPNYNNGNGSAGGAFIGEYNGKICFFGNAQQGNNLVAIYELKESSVGSYNYGENVTLTAMPNDGFHFVNWTENGTVISNDPTYSFTVTNDRTLVANFEGHPMPVEGLIAYYPFNGNANDESGYGNHGTLQGSVPQLTTDRFGNENSAYLFGGYYNSGYIYVPNSSSLQLSNAMSMSFWMNLNGYDGMDGWGHYTDNANFAIICKQGDRNGFNATLNQNEDGRLNIHSFNSNGSYDISVCQGYLLGQWLHCVITIEDNVSKLYINGMLQRDTIMSQVDFSNANNCNMYIGIMSAYWYPFNGKLDDIALYNRALSAQEVKQLYGLNENLIAYYPFDGDANDYSGNDYHATPCNSFQYESGITEECISVVGQGYTGSSGGHVLLPQYDFSTYSGVTLSLWVNAEGLTSSEGETYINLGNHTSQDGMYICQSSDAIQFQYHQANISIPYSDSYTGHWVMYTMTCGSDGKLKAYVNGTFVGEVDIEYDGQINSSLAALGRHWWYNGSTSSTRFTGSFDEVRIYGCALSPAEVQLLYQNDYLLNIAATANPTNGGMVSGAGTYSHGSTCTLTAIANPCHTFVNWTENGIQVSDDASYTFVVDGNRNLVANFIDDGFCCPITFDLHDSFGDGWNGNYLVVNYPDGSTQQLSVGSGYAASYTLPMEDLSHITLTWIAGSWISECSFTVSYSNGNVICYGSGLSSNYSYVFDVNCSEMPATTFDISAVSSPVGGGNITGTGTYPWNQTCTLTATPNAEYAFNRWTKNGTEVSSNPTYSFTVTQDAEYIAEFQQVIFTHTQTLESGWNWWSTYIELNDNDGLTQLENSLGSAANMIKSRSDGFVESYQFNGSTQWFGNLSSISNEKMYKIDMNVVGNVGLTGYLAGNSSHPITISPGWNWIGYPLIQPEAVSDALSGFSPATDDILKGRNSYTTYYSADGQQMWFGTLNTLEPGCGYMYQSQASDVKTLMFQPSRGSSLLPNITPINNLYQPVEKPFADNMTMTAVMEIDGEELRSDSYELTAFVGNECRGSVKLLYVEPLNRYMAFLTVFGATGDELEFHLTDGDGSLVSSDRLTYSSDAVVGTIGNPKTLHFGTAGLNEISRLVRVFPNPVHHERIVSLALPEATGAVVVEVSNMLGVTVLRYETVAEPISIVHIELPDKVIPGSYVLKTTTRNGTVYYSKLVVE